MMLALFITHKAYGLLSDSIPIYSTVSAQMQQGKRCVEIK